MTVIKARAPAKINLTLHVTGQRDDGYHLLDSLVVFADVADELTVQESDNLTLKVEGPGSEGVPTDHSNLVIRAAEVLRTEYDIEDGAAITLHKELPNAAGIGGGSADAAATLKLLAEFWDVPPLDPASPAIVGLGADVPVCMRTPRATRMTGIGDHLADVPPLPDCALVLVNPRVHVPTGPVFAGLATKTNPAMDVVPAGMDFLAFADWLNAQRNDLMPPALIAAPEVGRALAKLKALPAIKAVGMSGSGATCFGLVRDMADARQVARALQVGEMGWWVVPAPILK